MFFELLLHSVLCLWRLLVDAVTGTTGADGGAAEAMDDGATFSALPLLFLDLVLRPAYLNVRDSTPAFLPSVVVAGVEDVRHLG